MNIDHVTYLGHRLAYGGGELPFGIRNVDARQHTYILGKTGSGKTTLLRNMIIQQIEAGHGLTIIDPHGDLSEDLLNSIPPCRTHEVIYFNPSDLEFPVGINLLANVPKDDRHLVASGIVESFKSLWRDSWGPRMEYILYNALAALLDCENVSLIGVNRLLLDPDYRARISRQIKDPFIKGYWVEEFENYDERFRREAIAPIQNKLGQFLMNPPIRNILGQVQSKIDFRFMMDHNRIFICNLSKGKLGSEKANLLGSLITTQFQLAAMSRAGIPESQRKDFSLFIDEFHNFTTDSFATILAEARKYRLSLTLSHQYISQLNPKICEAVFGNVGTLACFRIGNSDAEIISREFSHAFPPSYFADLKNFEAVVRPLILGNLAEPFLTKTLRPLPSRHGRSQMLIELSRRRFATPREKVEQRIERWLKS